MPRSRSCTKNDVKVTRHLHKLGGGWTVHVKGERRAWFRNSKDLERWMGVTLTMETTDYLVDRMGIMDA